MTARAPTAFRFIAPIYPIVGDTVLHHSPVELAQQILACGIPLLQLRLKDTPTRRFVAIARELRKRCDRHRARLIINDRCDIAKLVGADGVHLGQDDLSPTAARQILGPGAIIGYSTHDRAQLGAATTNTAVDYVAYGPIFATSSKRKADPARGLARLRGAAAHCPCPLVAIGGIDEENVAEVLACGASAAAVIGAIAAADDPARATLRLLQRAANAR